MQSKRDKETMERKSRRRKVRKRKSFFQTLVVLGVMVLILTVFAGVGFSVGVLQALPDLDGSGLDQYAITTSIYDKDGELVAKLHGAENRIPVSLEEMSPHLINAVLAIEDQRFYSHFGIDPIRIVGAMVANLKEGRIVQGGSTITQQLVGLCKLDRNEKTFKRKIQEAVLAIKAEREYSKDEILEFYLNRAYFGYSAYGVEAAAQTYYDKHAKDLNIQESALLAGIIQNPYKHSPVRDMDAAMKRRNTVLNAMVDFGKLTAAKAEELKKTPIEISFVNIEKASYKYQSFVDYVVEQAIEVLNLSDEETKQIYTRGYKIYTTLDTKIQSRMEEVYANDENFPKGKGDQIIQSAMIVIDHRTGEIKGIIGGRKQQGQRVFNRATQAIRQPGSAFKPLVVFGPALEMGFTAATVLDDFPAAYPVPTGVWAPQNVTPVYRGLVPMRTAVQHSINTWSVKMLNKIGTAVGYEFAERLGISTLVPEGEANDKGLALALGGLTKGVYPLEIAAAYGAFANKGIYTTPYAIIRIEDQDGNVLWQNKIQQKRVMSEEVAYLITSMLQTVVKEGTGTRADIPGRAVAGKTGTTSDAKDAWFIGYTPEYVGAVWLGYDEPQRISGSAGGGANAGPIWKLVMQTALEGLPNSDFKRPDSIIEVPIDTKSGLLPSPLTPPEYIKTELFIEGTEPTEISNVWVTERVCMDSGEKASPLCFYTETKPFLVRPEPWTVEGLPAELANIVPEDAKLELPKNYCHIHWTSPGSPDVPGSDNNGNNNGQEQRDNGDNDRWYLFPEG